MINSVEINKKAYKTIDNSIIMYYIEYNIPARPLPKGKLNYGGFFIWGKL